jgi:hypothetical protein
VIGASTVSYGQGNITFGDFVAKFTAALIPAQQVLQMRRIVAQDRTLTTTPLDHARRAYRAEAAPVKAKAQHFLPVGAHDVLSHSRRRLVPAKEYPTLFGAGAMIEDRVHGEIVTFNQDFKKVFDGTVRVFDTSRQPWPKTTGQGDMNPKREYSWRQGFGPSFDMGATFAIDNGRCRVILDEDGRLHVQHVAGARYEDAGHAQLNYAVARVAIVSHSPDKAVVKLTLAGDDRLGEAFVTLERGWPGPAVDVYHFGDVARTSTNRDAHVERIGEWEGIRFGVDDETAMAHTSVHAGLVAR